MKMLEWVLEKYGIYRDGIFMGIGIFFVIVIMGGIIILRENMRYVINKLLTHVFQTIVICGIGIALALMGLKLTIEYSCFNAAFFLLIVLGIVIYGIMLSFMFRKIKAPILQTSKYLGYITLVELFLLAITMHLEFVEWLLATLAIICIELIPIVFEKVEEKQKKDNEEDLEEFDYPSSDLYYTRELQLKNFIKVLEYQKNEPYAIMISAEWGMGKSSFAKALEEKLTDSAFIWVKAGTEKSASEIMTDISEQILDVLKKDNVLIDNGSLIEKYFSAFAGVLEDTDLGFFSKIINLFSNGTVDDSKEYLISKLKELKKTIYIIIDDLDRCSAEYQEKMFRVIRESTDIRGCKTLFLVEKSEFLTQSHEEKYIEKYISYTLDLCEVEYQEIICHQINQIIKSEFLQSINIVLLKDRDVDAVKEMIYRLPEIVLQRCEDELGQEEDALKKRAENNKHKTNAENNIQDKRDEEIERAKINELKESIQIVNRNITNSRKVKNFLKGIKRDINNLSIGIEACDKELQREDWLQAIMEVQFIKNFLPELFINIKMCRNIWEFGKKTRSYTFEMVTGLKYGFLFGNEKKLIILDQIIYKVDVIDYAKVMSESRKYLLELDSEKVTIKHINQYLEYSQNLDDLTKVLNLCLRQEFENYIDRENFVKDILDILSRQSQLMKYKKNEFLNFSEQLIECFIQLKLSEKEINICIYEGRMIIRRVIVDNTHFLRNILMILFDVTTVGECWQSLAVTDIDEFYKMLKRIDDKSRYGGLEDDGNKLLSIKKYYANLIEELKKEKYEKVGLNVERLADELNTIFKICQLWNNMNILAEINDEETVLFNRYFELNGVYSFKDAVFEDVTCLKLALKELYDFFDRKAVSYESDYTLVLLRLAYRMVLLLEAKPSWYGDKLSEIADLLMSVAQKCYELDKIENDFACEVMDETKVYVYKFLSYVQNGEEADTGENNHNLSRFDV